MTTAMMTMMSIVTCIERFSNDCRKNNTKVNTATNHDKRKQRDEPIRTQPITAQCIVSSTLRSCDWPWV